MIKLANPWFLLIGFAFLPLLLRRKTSFLGYSYLTLLDVRGTQRLLQHLPSFVSGVAIGLLVFAMARPQWRTALQHETFRTRDILLVIDLSYSMENPIGDKDGVRKVDIAKKAALQFIEKRENDRIGLLVFGDHTFGSWPLTKDVDLVSKKVNRLGTSFYGGTNLSEPFLKVIDHFREMGQSENRVLVFLSDGEATIKQALRNRIVAEIEKMGIHFYLLGIEVRPQDSDILEIVKRTGGRFIPANSSTELEAAFDEIDRLEPSVVHIEVQQRNKELYPLFVSTALCLVFTLTVFQHTFFLEIC